MFAKTIVDSDAFLDMPLSTQALYFHLSMRADDDGFLNNANKIRRTIGASEDDLKLLILKRFVLDFDDGVIVIKHWRMNNYLRSDRYKPTVYQEEMAMLETKENGSYSLKNNSGIPNGYHLETQYSIGKDSIDKLSIDKDSIGNIYPPISPQGEEEIEKPKKKKTDMYYPNDEMLDCAFKEFLTMRNKIKKPIATKQALTRMMNKLEKLSNGDNDLAIKILNQSTDHCWSDVYKLKEDTKQTNQGTKWV